MFARTSALSLLALSLLAVATPVPDSTPASQCSTGDLQCCNSVQSVSSDAPF